MREASSMARPTILLADDHVVFMDGIVRILSPCFDVVGTVTDGSAILEAAARLHPDVIVTDISMPNVSGLEGLRQLKAKRITSKVIFLTMHADAGLAADAFRLGAKGFVLKHSSGEEVIKAIEEVLQGHTYMSAAVTDDVLALMAEPALPPGEALSAREKEVLRLIVNGQRMKEIARTLNLSPRTVETIKYEMMRDLKLHSTPELVRYAIEHRLVAF
jgi:DNA-binding NarL/FixJ family response regulator